MQSRVDRYTLTAQIKKLKRTAPCAIHQAKWIRDRAVAHDANAVLRPPPMAPALPVHGIEGLDSVLALARLPAEMEQMLEQQLSDLGAVSVKEVVQGDLVALPMWVSMRPLQQRRLLGALFGTAGGGA